MAKVSDKKGDGWKWDNYYMIHLLEKLTTLPKELAANIFHHGKYYKKIIDWHETNKKRKHPRTYYVFTLDKKDALKNATFCTYEFGIKEEMITRGYLNKIAGLLPMMKLKEKLLKIAGVKIEEDVFIAPEVTIDPILKGWIRFRSGSSIGWGCKFFNHMFERNGKIIIGYIDIGEDASIGGFVTICPGVTIGKKASVGAEAKIAPGATIEPYAKIGAGSLISPFITVGEGSEVTVGSVVTSNVPPGVTVQGNPAKIIAEKSKLRKPRLDLIVNNKINNDSEATN